MSTVWLRCLVVLMSAWHHDATGKVIQTYQFEDPQGYESSFLIDGGRVVITCTDTNNGSVTIVRRINENIVEKIENPSPSDYYVPLNATLVNLNEDYQCFGASGGELAVKAVYCDPFQMIPPVLNCGADEACMIYNASSAKCGKKLSRDCFLREFKNVNPQDYPKPSVVCTTTDSQLSGENGKTKYGLCHARVGSDKPFEGLSENVADCLRLKELVFNGMTVKQDKLLFTTKNPSAWSITYNDQSYYKRCIAYDSDNSKFAKYETNNSNKLEKITSNMPTKLPSKLRLDCKISGHLINQPDTWSISTFVIMYDNTKSLYSAEIKLDNSTKKQALDLTCRCKIPPGFFCSLSWEKSKKVKEIIEYSESDTLIRKTIFKDDHDKSTEYSCYMRIWVSNYPVNFQLINVPDIDDISVTKSVTKNDFKNLVPKPQEGAGNDTGDGNGGGSNDKDSNKNDQSDKGDQSSSNTLVYVITAILAIAILVAVIAGILFVIRKRNKRKREEEDKIVEKENQEKNVKHEQNLANILLKEKQLKRQAKEEKMARVKLLRKDIKHQRDADELLALHRSKTPISQHAKELAPTKKHPNFELALQKYPQFCFVRDEWTDIEEAKCLRRLSEPRVIGYLIGCRYPAMPCTIKTFVAQDRVALLQKEPPTPEQQRLQRSANPPKPSALNANFVHDLHGRKFFILCQAPRLVDMELFLDMIISQQVKMILSLISTKDLPDTINGIQKYYPYNELEEGQSSKFGPYTLTSVLKVANVCFTTTSFRITGESATNVKQKQLSHDLTVVSYVAWGDHSSPADCYHILSLKKSIDNVMASAKMDNDTIASQATLTSKGGASIAAKVSAPTVDNRKVVVHCSAGLGRSGALATAYILLQYLEIYGCPVNIHGMAELVRLDRENTIQDVEQYLLLYWIAADYERNKLAALGPQRKQQSQLTSVAKQMCSTNSKSDARL